MKKVEWSSRNLRVISNVFYSQGWGCGYRTLQSLCSWAENKLKQQSMSPHTAVPTKGGGVAGVPSLRKIQEILVEVGDKPQSFVDSREWIGSFEACIVLDHVFGVRCCTVIISTNAYYSFCFLCG